MAGQFGLRFRLPRKSQGSFTCRKSATWTKRLYSPPREDMLWIFSPKKSDGFGRVRTREASMLTTSPPKPLGLHRRCHLVHTGFVVDQVPLGQVSPLPLLSNLPAVTIPTLHAVYYLRLVLFTNLRP
jgi:hypothetical protein